MMNPKNECGMFRGVWQFVHFNWKTEIPHQTKENHLMCL